MVSSLPFDTLRLARTMSGPLIGAALMAMAGVASAQTAVAARDMSALVPHCSAPVASLVVGNFSCRASACSAPPQGPGSGIAALMAMQNAARTGAPVDLSHFGDSLGSAVTTALKATGCFTVQDRQAIEELKKEAEISGVEFKPKPSDFLVSGSITEVTFKANSTAIGGGFIPVIGALSTTNHEARVAIEVRILDVKNGSILDSQTFEANSSKRDFGIGGIGFGRGGALGGGVSSTNSPELDSVANQTVVVAIGHVTNLLAKDAITSQPAPPPPPK